MATYTLEIAESTTNLEITESVVEVSVTDTDAIIEIANAGTQGIPGVANSLSIGTVTTGAAGSSASATITGDSPNQTLNLTIPRGDTGNYGVELTSGYYYAPEGTTTQRSFSLNYVYYVPFIFPSATTLSKLGVMLISTALSNTVRLAIYDSDENNKPANLLAETTTVQTGTGQATGFKALDIEVTVEKGLYYLAFVNQGSVPSTFLANNFRSYFIPQGTLDSPVTTASNTYQHWNQSGVTGAFPASATPILFDASVQPRIFMGVA